MKFYIIGIPTHPDLVKSELLSFIDQDLPTLYLHQLNRSIHDEKNTINGFNFFNGKNFDPRRLSDLITESDIGTQTICAVPRDQLRYNDQEQLTAKDQAQRLLQLIGELATKFPNTRMAFVTFGNCFTFYEYLSELVKLESEIEFEVINTENYTDQDINNFSKASAVLGYQMYRPHYNTSYPPNDRLGIFFQSTEQAITSWDTNKSFAQIVDETANNFKNSNNLVAWSGGIDSTMVIASFVKNNVPFSFTVTPSTISENNELFQLLRQNYNFIELDENVDMSAVDTAYTVVTGDCADQLYPGIWHNFIPGGVQFKEVIGKNNFHNEYAEYFESNLNLNQFQNNVRTVFISEYKNKFNCSDNEAAELYETYLETKFSSFPFTVQHYYQLRWFFRFIFRYNDNAKSRFKKVTKCRNEVVAFYDTVDFQKWAVTNLDQNFENYSVNYQTYKQFQKDYNHSIFGLDNLLTQTKFPSLPASIL